MSDLDFGKFVSKFQPQEAQFASRNEQHEQSGLNQFRREVHSVSQTQRNDGMQHGCLTNAHSNQFGDLTLFDGQKEVATTNRGYVSNAERHGNFGTNANHHGNFESHAAGRGNYGTNATRHGNYESHATGRGNYGTNVTGHGNFESYAAGRGNYGTNMGGHGNFESHAGHGGFNTSNISRTGGFGSHTQLQGTWRRYGR